MARRHTKAEAIRIVVDCAIKYREVLDGHTLLFVCQDKHKTISTFECSFFPGNFLHLTGLKTRSPIGAIDFYNRCVNHHLSAKDFEIASDGTTDLKLNVLPRIINKSLSANMIGDYMSRTPHLYTEKLAGGVKACMGFVMDRRTGVYVPNTVLQDDIRECTSIYTRVIAVYRKKATEERYAETTYAVKKIEWDKVRLPTEIRYITSLHDDQPADE